MEQGGLGLWTVVRYAVLPAGVLVLITLWGLRARRWPAGPAGADRWVWMLMAAFTVVYGAMGVLRYLAYRTTIQDLGV